MMREILFRGKELDGGDWVEGYLIRNDSICYPALFIGMIEASRTRYGELSIDGHYLPQVDPDTVGQYTGMTDKNGKRIFEGDIVKTHYANTPKPDFIEQVVFLNGRFCSLYEFGKSKMWSRLPDKDFKPISDYAVYMEWCEVIGNIHDNPELIAEAQDETATDKK